jgi:cbb3-type cytochrome oxidase maturation protein
MEVLVILVPLALGLGLVGLLGFLWSLKSGQYDDLEGAAWRAIADDEPTEGDRYLAFGTIEPCWLRRCRRCRHGEHHGGDPQFIRHPCLPNILRVPAHTGEAHAGD